MGKGSSHIIVILISGFRKFPEFRHDQIIASGAFAEWSHVVVYLFTAVHAENNIGHLTITELHYLIIKKNTVGGKSKSEFLVMKLFLLSSVSDQIFYNLPVHQRLAAKKIHLQVSSGAGIGNQKIQGLFSNLKGHQGSSSMVFSLLRKTVVAGKIAVMGNVQAKRFYNRTAVFGKLVNCAFINISGKKHSLFFQLFTFRNRSSDLPLSRLLKDLPPYMAEPHKLHDLPGEYIRC